MENEFQMFHGDTLDKSEFVFTRLKNCIKCKYPDIDDFVILCFVRTRTFIRLKSLNRRQQLSKHSRGENRKFSKKMKKIV